MTPDQPDRRKGERRVLKYCYVAVPKRRQPERRQNAAPQGVGSEQVASDPCIAHDEAASSAPITPAVAAPMPKDAPLGEAMKAIRDRAIANGLKLLSIDEINALVDRDASEAAPDKQGDLKP